MAGARPRAPPGRACLAARAPTPANSGCWRGGGGCERMPSERRRPHGALRSPLARSPGARAAACPPSRATRPLSETHRERSCGAPQAPCVSSPRTSGAARAARRDAHPVEKRTLDAWRSRPESAPPRRAPSTGKRRTCRSAARRASAQASAARMRPGNCALVGRMGRQYLERPQLAGAETRAATGASHRTHGHSGVVVTPESGRLRIHSAGEACP